MDNNKNRQKDRPKSNAERRKIYPKANANLGVIDGEKMGHYANSKDHSGKNEITY